MNKTEIRLSEATTLDQWGKLQAEIMTYPVVQTSQKARRRYQAALTAARDRIVAATTPKAQPGKTILPEPTKGKKPAKRSRLVEEMTTLVGAAERLGVIPKSKLTEEDPAKKEVRRRLTAPGIKRKKPVA